MHLPCGGVGLAHVTSFAERGRWRLQFIALTELGAPVKGYLVDDTLVVEAQVMLLNDMANMDTEAITFDVRGELFKVLKSSLKVR